LKLQNWKVIRREHNATYGDLERLQHHHVWIEYFLTLTQLIDSFVPFLVRAIRPVQIKIGWRKLKIVSLAPQNGFGPAFLHSLLGLVQGTAQLNTCC
jgi:hypothetical protein